jgi:hypothetical protein
MSMSMSRLNVLEDADATDHEYLMIKEHFIVVTAFKFQLETFETVCTNRLERDFFPYSFNKSLFT